MIWTAGRIVDDDALAVPALDRTFEHGLGLFETFRTWGGRATLLPRHLERLACSADALCLALDSAVLPDQEAVDALLGADGREGDAVLRITLTGGVSATSPGMLWMRAAPLPPAAGEGVVLGPIGPARPDGLAAHKTLNYWSHRRLFEEARRGGFDEALTITPDGHLLEGTRTNLFVVMGDVVLTPPADDRILPGILRGVILERGAGLGLDLREEPLSLLDRLLRPEEVFLTNAVRGIVPVRRWGEAEYPAPGPVTRRLSEDLLAWLESGGERA